MLGFRSSALPIGLRPWLLTTLVAATPAMSPVAVLAGDPVVRPTVVSAETLGLQIGPETTVVSGPLSPEGLPDYVEALNQQLSEGISRDENFWALAWQALGNAERSSPEYIAAVEKRLGITISREPRMVDMAAANGVTGAAANPIYDQQGKASSAPWKREDYPAIARWLDANAEQLKLLEEAARRPKAYSPLVSNSKPALIGVLLPHVQRSREMARLLTARSMLRLGEGDVEGSWNDLMTTYRIARHVESGFTLIERLVAVAVRSLATESMSQWLSRSELSADELDAHWKQLAPLVTTESFSHSVQLERLMYADTVIALVSNQCTLQQLQGDIVAIGGVAVDQSWMEQAGAKFWKGTEEALSRLAVASIDVNTTLRFGNHVYDDIVAAMSPETHSERMVKLTELDARIKAMTESVRNPGALLADLLLSPKAEASELPGRVLVSLLTPAVTQCERAQTSSEARGATLEAAFRIKIATQRSGALPASLEELIGGGEKPLSDPFTGKPLSVRSDERGIVISSVGPNGKDEKGLRGDEQPGADDIRTILVLQ